MSIEILMPALSPTMTEGNLTKWLVTEGQEVKAGDVIAEIETDKATMEVEAVDEGFVEKLLFKEGDVNIPVNKTIALISDQQSLQSKDTKQKQESVEKKIIIEKRERKKTENLP
jgi:pyruvate/2-oxoglutarate dehydrogenase complex dihydrolipoamide acyltransferase (E2) component